MSSQVADDQSAITALLADYYRAFSTLHLPSIVAYFHEPCLLVGPQGVSSAPTRPVLTASLTPLMETLRHNGYARSELVNQQFKSLSSSAALLTGVAVRFKHDGQELSRAGLTYVMHKTDLGWKIAALITHDV